MMFLHCNQNNDKHGFDVGTEISEEQKNIALLLFAAL